MFVRGKHNYRIGQVVFQVTLTNPVLMVCSVTKVTSATYHVLSEDGDVGRGWSADPETAFEMAYRDAWWLRIADKMSFRDVAGVMAALKRCENDWHLERAKANLRARRVSGGRGPRCEIGTTHCQRV